MKKGILAAIFASMFLLNSCALFIYEDDCDDDRYGCDHDSDTLMIIYSSKAGNPVLP
ncbi:MAG: hypothetical protein JW915_15725 [Chitinispirillaceae bacterium]|nr:hypothetical protein [Chitinispirillaceae bacterium]